MPQPHVTEDDIGARDATTIRVSTAGALTAASPAAAQTQRVNLRGRDLSGLIAAILFVWIAAGEGLVLDVVDTGTLVPD